MEISTTSMRKGCVYPEAALLSKMQEYVAGRTDSALTERFGISYNTWRRLMAGEPVRGSLLARLRQRLDTIEQSQPSSGASTA